MAPQFPHPGILNPESLNPRTPHSGGPQRALQPGTPRLDRRSAGSRYLTARVVATVAGVAGFLGLLLAAAYASSGEAVLRISAFVWFFGFGALRVVLDVRASRASRRRGTCSGEHDRRLGGGLL
jgi:hypothetical protein